MSPARFHGTSTSRRAFSLAELMVAVAIFALASGMIYEMFSTVLYQTAKNSSLNNSNTDLQHSYVRLLSALESAAAIVDCADFDTTTKAFVGRANGTWANSVRFMRQVGTGPDGALLSFYVKPDSGTDYNPVNNPKPLTTQIYLSSTSQSVSLLYDPKQDHPLDIPASARLYPTYPKVSELVSGGASPGQKPGLGISKVAFTAGQVGTTPANTTSATVTLTMNNALGSNVFLACNRAYLLVESAFAVIQPSAGSPKQLLYFADTTQTASPLVVCRNLDTTNVTQPNDTSIPTGGTSGTFCLPVGATAVQTLLPIRSQEYTNAITRQGGATALNNTLININARFRQRQSF